MVDDGSEAEKVSTEYHSRQLTQPTRSHRSEVRPVMSSKPPALLRGSLSIKVESSNLIYVRYVDMACKKAWCVGERGLQCQHASGDWDIRRIMAIQENLQTPDR